MWGNDSQIREDWHNQAMERNAAAAAIQHERQMAYADAANTRNEALRTQMMTDQLRGYGPTYVRQSSPGLPRGCLMHLALFIGLAFGTEYASVFAQQTFMTLFGAHGTVAVGMLGWIAATGRMFVGFSAFSLFGCWVLSFLGRRSVLNIKRGALLLGALLVAASVVAAVQQVLP